jgi:hypothetical protein
LTPKECLLRRLSIEPPRELPRDPFRQADRRLGSSCRSRDIWVRLECRLRYLKRTIVRIATYNVNGINGRLTNLLDWR